MNPEKNLLPIIRRVFPELLMSDICHIQPMTTDISDLFHFITQSSRLDIPWKQYWSLETVPSNIVNLLYGWECHYVSLNDIIDKYTKERNHRIGTLEVSEFRGVKTERILTENDVPNYLETSELKKFIETLKNGDRIVHYISSEASWCQLAGREGLAIVRDGSIVDNYGLRMS